MMRFPIGEVLNEKQCYDFLSKTLHSDGLHCPDGHILPPDQVPHDRHRDPFFDYRCKICGKVFNIFTDTIWSGSRYSCITIVLIIRGIVQGIPTMHLAEELGIDLSHLLEIRHKIQKWAEEHLPRSPLPDINTEADEMFQNAGEKGDKHDDPDDPPRRRANKKKGIGTMTVMVFVKFIAIRTKVSGQGCATFCALFEGYTRSICLSILRCSSRRTISNGSYQNS